MDIPPQSGAEPVDQTGPQPVAQTSEESEPAHQTGFVIVYSNQYQFFLSIDHIHSILQSTWGKPLDRKPPTASIVDVSDEELASICKLALTQGMHLSPDAARDFVPMRRRLIDTALCAMFAALNEMPRSVPIEGIQRSPTMPSEPAGGTRTSTSGASLHAEFPNAKTCKGIPFKPHHQHFMVTSAFAVCFEQTNMSNAVLGKPSPSPFPSLFPSPFSSL